MVSEPLRTPHDTRHQQSAVAALDKALALQQVYRKRNP